MGSAKEKSKQDELIEYLDSIGDDAGGELDAFTRRVGAKPLTLLGTDKKPVEVLVRPISRGAELCVGSAIPRPRAPLVADKDGVEQPNYADEIYLYRLATRTALFEAGLAAVAIDLTLDGGRSYRKPGAHANGNIAARTLFVRDAARFMVLSHTGDEIARILETLNEINDPGKLIGEAGKNSAPISATSKKTPESGAKKAQVSPPTSSPGPVHTDQDS